ncbi:MAG: hypothetical protein AAGH78_11880, partial [Cyanobacteria bacterium P01_H01_bin.58]
MKNVLFSAIGLATVGMVVTNPLVASAAEFWGTGPVGSTAFFSDFIDTTTLIGDVDTLTLNFEGIELGAGTTVSGSLSRGFPEGEAEIEYESYGFDFTLDASGDASFVVDNDAVSEGLRGDIWYLELFSNSGESEAEESSSGWFDFDWWSVAIAKAGGGEQCDTLEALTDAGTFIIDQTCYNPNDIRQDGDLIFTPILSGTGVFKDANGVVDTYQDPGSVPPGVPIDHPVNTETESPILFEGTRSRRASGYARGSSTDFDYSIDCDFQDPTGTSILPLTTGCLDDHGNLRIEGSFILVDDHGFIIGDPESIVSATADIPTQDVPEPSLLLGLLAVVGLTT